MLRTTFTNTITTPVPTDITRDSIITFLQTPSNLIDLSPIVTRYEQSGTSEYENTTCQLYDVWEVINVLPKPFAGVSWSPKREIHFRTGFHVEPEEGCTTWIEAPLGLVSKAVYRVKVVVKEGGEVGDGGGREGTWVLEETVKSSVNAMLKLVVEGQLVQTRKEMHTKMFHALRNGKAQ